MRIEVNHYSPYKKGKEPKQEEKETYYFLLPYKAYY